MMEIIQGDYRIHMRKIDSMNEMKEMLTRCKCGFIEHKKPDYHNSYYLLYYYKPCESGRFGIGIYSDSSGSPPTIVSTDNQNCLTLLVDNQVLIFDLCSRQLQLEHVSDTSLIFAKYFKNTIVVISELSVTQLMLNGDVLVTHFFDDIIESFNFNNSLLIYSTMSSNGSVSLSEYH